MRAVWIGTLCSTPKPFFEPEYGLQQKSVGGTTRPLHELRDHTDLTRVSTVLCAHARAYEYAGGDGPKFTVFTIALLF